LHVEQRNVPLAYPAVEFTPHQSEFARRPIARLGG
jgi:hypothetical protein